MVSKYVTKSSSNRLNKYKMLKKAQQNLQLASTIARQISPFYIDLLKFIGSTHPAKITDPRFSIDTVEGMIRRHINFFEDLQDKNKNENYSSLINSMEQLIDSYETTKEKLEEENEGQSYFIDQDWSKETEIINSILYTIGTVVQGFSGGQLSYPTEEASIDAWIASKKAKFTKIKDPSWWDQVKTWKKQGPHISEKAWGEFLNKFQDAYTSGLQSETDKQKSSWIDAHKKKYGEMNEVFWKEVKDLMSHNMTMTPEQFEDLFIDKWIEANKQKYPSIRDYFWQSKIKSYLKKTPNLTAQSLERYLTEYNKKFTFD